MITARGCAAFITSASLAAVGVVGFASAAQASVLDREQKRCGSALVTAKLESDSQEKEVDVEVYSDRAGERWRVVIKDVDGGVLRTVTRTTNRDGEFDFWRSIPGAINDVTVDVRGPSGQRCSVQLQG